MNVLITLGILSAISLMCAMMFGFSSFIIGCILRRVRHRKLMQPQNVYFHS